MKKLKLAQVLAVEKTVKTTTNRETSELFKASQKAELFNGVHKVYVPKEEDGEKLPPQSQKVQLEAVAVLKATGDRTVELIDVTATKDYANTKALADVEVDGEILIKQAPVPFLLFLDKTMNDWLDSVEKLPTLDPAEDWALDMNSGLHRTDTVKTHRTRKVNKALVLYPATDKHPAQTQMVTEDVVDGFWETTKFSGAISAPRKAQLLDRGRRLKKAVKQAIEEANSTAADEQKIGEGVFGYLLK